jgi:nicotinamidase-related amidase
MAWDPLPETVTITVDTPTPKALTLDPKKTAVVVVDMQNNFCKKGNERSFNVIEGNVRLLEKARAAGATVIYVQSVRTEDSPEHTFYKLPLHLIVGTWDVEIVEEIAPKPGRGTRRPEVEPRCLGMGRHGGAPRRKGHHPG